jgi:hypothetical protein
LKLFLPLVCVAIFWINCAYAQEQTKFETTSDERTFRIEINWIPAELGRENTFEITFIEPETGIKLEDIKYTFSVKDSETEQQIIRKVDQVSTEQQVRFDKVGPYTLMIQDIEGLGENAELQVEVTPEFPPLPTLAITSIAIIAVILIRRNGKYLFTSSNKD